MNIKPRVLQLTGSFHTGGSERQAVQLARLLHADGEFQVFVAALTDAGALRGEIEELNLGAIEAFPLDSFYDANFVRQLRRAARFIRENKIDVVQTHDFYTNVFGMAAARLAGARARIAAKRETGAMRSGGQIFIERQAFRLAHRIVVNSAAVGDFLKKQNIPERKISLIYNGLDLARLAVNQPLDEIRREFALPADRKFVTIVANLRHTVKNIPLFLRAAQTVKNKFPRAAFLIAGEGELLPELRRLAAKLEIEPDVFFLGRTARVAELLAVSDVCVLCSTAEGFSNSILEYMAAARPVVATRVGGAAEAVAENETGFLIESNDAAALAEKVLLLLENDRQAAEFGRRGRAVVEEKFSLAAQLEETKMLYRVAVSG